MFMHPSPPSNRCVITGNFHLGAECVTAEAGAAGGMYTVTPTPSAIQPLGISLPYSLPAPKEYPRKLDEYQKMNLSPTCMVRFPDAPVTMPNWVLAISALTGLLHVLRLKML